MRQRRPLLVIVMVSGALYADAPLAAQRVAERSVALSSGLGGHSALDSFRVNDAVLNRSTTGRGELFTVHTPSPSAALEEAPDLTDVREVRSELLAHRSPADRLLPFDDPAPLTMTSHVLVGGLLGAVVGAGGAALYLANNCNDCIFPVMYAIGLAGVGGAIVGGLAGAYVFELRRAGRQ